MIDIHVHLRDWAQEEKETVRHGLMAAYKAGVRRVFDMPNTIPAITDREVALERLSLASDVIKSDFKRKKMSYGIYMGLTDDDDQIGEAVQTWSELFPMVVGLKMFLGQSTGHMGIVEKEQQRKVFQTLSRLGFDGVLVVHAEKESLLKKERFDIEDFSTHSDARPAEAEIESVRDALELVKETGFKGNLHIAHTSTKGAVELIKDAKGKGLKVTFGVTPHHALLTKDDAKDRSLFLKMNPPLRCEEDRKAVFGSLLDGSADTVESDHAPHTLLDKENGASGIPCFAGMDILLDRLRKAGASEERLKDLYGRNALRIFKMDDEEVFLPKDPMRRAREVSSLYPISPFEKLL